MTVSDSESDSSESEVTAEPGRGPSRSLSLSNRDATVTSGNLGRLRASTNSESKKPLRAGRPGATSRARAAAAFAAAAATAPPRRLRRRRLGCQRQRDPDDQRPLTLPSCKRSTGIALATLIATHKGNGTPEGLWSPWAAAAITVAAVDGGRLPLQRRRRRRRAAAADPARAQAPPGWPAEHAPLIRARASGLAPKGVPRALPGPCTLCVRESPPRRRGICCYPGSAHAPAGCVTYTRVSAAAPRSLRYVLLPWKCRAHAPAGCATYRCERRPGGQRSPPQAAAP